MNKFQLLNVINVTIYYFQYNIEMSIITECLKKHYL
jgi:hypothetical protein